MTKKILQLTLAAVLGVSALVVFVPQALAQGNQTVCYRGRTITVPSAVAQRYINSGATNGPCNPSQF